MPLDEREQIATDLQNRLTSVQLKELVNMTTPDLTRKIPLIMRTDGLFAPPITDTYELAGILADLHGSELLRERAVREAILARASDEVLAELLAASDKLARRRHDKIEAIAGCKWTPGKKWARTFVSALNLPACLAGTPSESGLPALETINPYVPLKPLHDFQVQLRDQVIEMLTDATSRRAILTLPTGAGKTRTTVEALVGYLRAQHEPSGVVLWIAQSEELCEQAVAAFREVWTEQLIRESQDGYLSAPRSLQIHRLWRNYSYPSEGLEPGSVVVAGMQKLNASTEIDSLSSHVAVMVIDEAHHAIAQSYTQLLRTLDKIRRPIIGLTATPFRGNQDESRQLIRRFHSNLIAPKLTSPMEDLRNRGILSRIVAEEHPTYSNFTLDARELAHVQQMHDLSNSTLNRIGHDADRNRMILARLLNIPNGKAVLFFGCNVEHSRLIAMLLRRKGRTAASITSDTPDTMRRKWIQEFKDGTLQYLCNVGVLTTGFDAPKIEIVAIARPTASVLLYEQMVGRGMRGPANGGTEECLLIDFTDNIDNFSEPMSYTRISQMWSESSLRVRQITQIPGGSLGETSSSQ